MTTSVAKGATLALFLVQARCLDEDNDYERIVSASSAGKASDTFLAWMREAAEASGAFQITTFRLPVLSGGDGPSGVGEVFEWDLVSQFDIDLDPDADPDDLANRSWVIEVACLSDFDDLDPDDRLPDGSCAVDGMWGAEFDAPISAEEALDRFHAEVPIASLEDFDITARRRRPEDLDADMRGGFGPGHEAEAAARMQARPADGFDPLEP